MIYLDNAATMPPISGFDYTRTMREYFNPSASYGADSRKCIQDCRAVIAAHLGASVDEIFFTSCATESNNWVVRHFSNKKNGNIVVSSGEHASIYEPLKRNFDNGYDVRFARLLPSGAVDQDHLLSLVDQNTVLVSCIHVSNETGTINNLSEISKKVKKVNAHAVFHSDGVQAFYKTETRVRVTGVDLYSFSGHKIGAFKGIGGLYVKKPLKLMPLLFGGEQESGLRAGTENLPGILSLYSALTQQSDLAAIERVKSQADTLRKKILNIGGVALAGDEMLNSGFIQMFLFDGVNAESLQTVLFEKGVAVGRGSACNSKKKRNRVLEAMGYAATKTDGAIRLSLSFDTPDEDIAEAVRIIEMCVTAIREGRIATIL